MLAHIILISQPHCQMRRIIIITVYDDISMNYFWQQGIFVIKPYLYLWDDHTAPLKRHLHKPYFPPHTIFSLVWVPNPSFSALTQGSKIGFGLSCLLKQLISIKSLWFNGIIRICGGLTASPDCKCKDCAKCVSRVKFTSSRERSHGVKGDKITAWRVSYCKLPSFSLYFLILETRR